MAGNPIRGGFGIPWIKGKHGRFCPHCGRSIRQFFEQKTCPYLPCRKRLTHAKPTLPEPYFYCRECKDGVVRKDDHNCTLCRWVTPYGRKVDSALGDLRLKQAALHKQFEATVASLNHEDEFKPISIASNSVTVPQNNPICTPPSSSVTIPQDPIGKSTSTVKPGVQSSVPEIFFNTSDIDSALCDELLRNESEEELLDV